MSWSNEDEGMEVGSQARAQGPIFCGLWHRVIVSKGERAFAGDEIFADFGMERYGIGLENL